MREVSFSKLNKENREIAESKERREKARRMLIVKIVIVVFLLFSLFRFYDNHRKLAMMQQKIDDLRTGMEDLKAENTKLDKMLHQMDSGDYIERIAREELGMVKKGEILIVPVDKGKKK